MLTIHVLRPGGHRYYLDDLVPGRPEGTGLTGEVPGVWAGRASSDLHLDGVVGARELERLLAGRHPVEGRALRRHRADGSAGFDLTFGAPKSVSILRLLAPPEMAAEVGAGHGAAVDDAVGYLERAATGVRRGSGGQRALLDATGLVGAAFVHRTSRALDPHLHTHLVVANVVQGVDGTWSSLDSRRLFRHARSVRAVYHARLRHELTERLGVAWEVRPSGMGDVVGVDPVLCRAFSVRAAEVDEHVHRRGPSLGRAASAPSRRLAALVTRPSKDRSRCVDDLVPGWRLRALELGHPPSELTRVVGLGRSHLVAEGPGPERSEPRQGDRGPDLGALERRFLEIGGTGRSVERRELVAEVAAACPAGATAAAVESVAERLAERAAGRGDTGSPTRASSAEDRWTGRELAEAVAGLSPSEGRPERARSAAWPSARALTGERERVVVRERGRPELGAGHGLGLGW